VRRTRRASAGAAGASALRVTQSALGGPNSGPNKGFVCHCARDIFPGAQDFMEWRGAILETVLVIEYCAAV